MALRPRDSQKQKVYDWDAHFRKDRLTLVQCQTLVNRACAAHNVRPPKVQASYGSTAYYKPMLNTITLPPWAQNSATVLHEVSHAVIDKKFSRFPVKTEDAASFGEPLKLYQPLLRQSNASTSCITFSSSASFSLERRSSSCLSSSAVTSASLYRSRNACEARTQS